jgi:hypothetical protein
MVVGIVLFGSLSDPLAKVHFPCTPKVSHTSPEANLNIAIPAAALLTISTFWCAWTSGPEVHYMVSAVAGIPLGMSFMIMFRTWTRSGCVVVAVGSWLWASTVALARYGMDTYTIYTPSLLGANALARRVWAWFV